MKASSRSKAAQRPSRQGEGSPRKKSKPALPAAARGSTNPIIRELKIAEQVARDVVRDMTSRRLEPGESLASEGVMLEMYGVSRQSLREGLRLLEVQGLISIRRGTNGGPIVTKADPSHLGRVSTLSYHRAGATYRELLEAWCVAETILAERAAKHPDDETRRSAMLPYMHDHPGDEVSLDDFVRSHVGFHAAVASLARNKVLEVMLQTMGTIVSHHSAVIGDPRDFRDVLVHDHHALARAITAGRAQRARSLMESHLEGLCAMHLRTMGKQADELIEWL
jgi:GntR family transcriptional repressor for pyruvate dehydrogenase complex